MKKALLICCAMILAFSVIGAYAQDCGEKGAIEENDFNYEKSPANKLGRGLINTATCWAEIPGEIAKISKEKDPLVGTAVGIIQGTFLALVRGATGIFDVATCIFPPYDKPMMKPEYGIVRADKEFKDYLW